MLSNVNLSWGRGEAVLKYTGKNDLEIWNTLIFVTVTLVSLLTFGGKKSLYIGAC